MYSLQYPESIIDDYLGGLAFESLQGFVNFCWLEKGMLVRDMKRLAQENANELEREVVLVRHDGKKNKIFKPEVED